LHISKIQPNIAVRRVHWVNVAPEHGYPPLRGFFSPTPTIPNPPVFNLFQPFNNL